MNQRLGKDTIVRSSKTTAGRIYDQYAKTIEPRVYLVAVVVG